MVFTPALSKTAPVTSLALTIHPQLSPIPKARRFPPRPLSILFRYSEMEGSSKFDIFGLISLSWTCSGVSPRTGPIRVSEPMRGWASRDQPKRCCKNLSLQILACKGFLPPIKCDIFLSFSEVCFCGVHFLRRVERGELTCLRGIFQMFKGARRGERPREGEPTKEKGGRGRVQKTVMDRGAERGSDI